MSLVTSARAKQDPAINRLSSVASPLGYLEHLLDAASKQVEKFTGRIFEYDEYLETIDGHGTIDLYLKAPPISTIKSVSVTQPGVGGTTTAYASTDFTIDYESGYIRFKDTSLYFPEGYQNIAVQYFGGFVTIPENIQIATIQIALTLGSQGSTSNDLALGTESSGDYRSGFRQQAQVSGLFSPAVKQLLYPYCVWISSSLVAYS
jgi:hypothetical protein